MNLSCTSCTSSPLPAPQADLRHLSANQQCPLTLDSYINKLASRCRRLLHLHLLHHILHLHLLHLLHLLHILHLLHLHLLHLMHLLIPSPSSPSKKRVTVVANILSSAQDRLNRVHQVPAGAF